MSSPSFSIAEETGKNHARNGDLDRRTVARAYALWAPVYDAVCGPILATGRRAAANAASRIGGRILEIGVGTGLSFAQHAVDGEIFGIDLSEPMLCRARRRLAAGRYPQVGGLAIMDAHCLAFADCAFDCVIIPFVITLVASPEYVLAESARVTKPGGEIILVSHFYSETGPAAALERWLGRRAGILGLRPDFPLRRMLDWAQTQSHAEVIEHRKIPPLGVYTLLRIQRR
jgi:phosphatidylethanolamine/phosphatidyl-N-methylethanolamine N-methyltransferase